MQCIITVMLLPLRCSVLLSPSAAIMNHEDVGVLQDFFISVNYKNTTPLTAETGCIDFPDLITCNSEYVEELNFTNQMLQGTFPESLGNLSHLSQFIVTNNSLRGTLPSGYSRWKSTILIFDVRMNQLSGTLPPEYGSWSGVTKFQVNVNQLSGILPAEFGSKFRVISYFDVSDNAITGTLPPEYGNMASALILFSCQGNRLNGSLPLSYSKWRALTSFASFDNMLLEHCLLSTVVIIGRLRDTSTSATTISLEVFLRLFLNGPV